MALPRNASTIANEIAGTWTRVYFGAVPYIEALQAIDSTDLRAPYYAETLRDVLIGFLANATTWRGEDARRIKAEIKGALTARV